MITPAKFRLGRKLFVDRRLSQNGTLSCAMCHVPEQGFAVNETAIAVGIEGKSLLRNAPSLLNVAFMETLFHNGRETALETQVISPLLAADEMGNPSIGYLLARIRGMEDYNGLFETAFDRGVSIGTVGEAIASYMHDGSPGTLHEVLAFYNRGGHPHEGLDPLIKPLGLEKEEMDALEAFLNSLTGDSLRELTEDARSEPTGNPGGTFFRTEPYPSAKNN